MFQIKQSEGTAARRRIPVLLVDITDGFTPETGVVTPTINISKNGATSASGAGTWTEIGNGQYYYEFTTGEVDTLGWIAVNIEKATVSRDYNAVVQVMAYDYAAATNLGLSAIPAVATGSAGAIPTTGTGANQIQVNGSGAISTVNTVSGSVGSVTGNVGGNVVGSVGNLAVAAVDAIWNEPTSSLTVVGSVGKLLVDNVNATISSRATDAGVWAVGTRTLTAGTNIVLAKGTGITGFNDISATDVWAAATRTLSSGANIVLAKGTGITGFNDITSQSVWDVQTSAITAVGSIGVQLKTNIDVATSTRMATFTYTAPPSVAQIADGVWDEVLSGHLTVGTTGAALNSASSSGDPWNTVLPGVYGAGTAGNIIGNRLDAAVSSRSTLTDALVWSYATRALTDKSNFSLAASQTFNLTGNITGNLSGSVGSVSGNVGGSVASVAGSIGGNVNGTVASVVGNVGGNVVGSVGSVSGTVGSVSNVSNIWDYLTTNILTTNSIGLLLKTNVDATISSRLASSSYTAAPTVSQIWQQALPSTFSIGQAGYILGTNLNDTITSRMATFTYTAPPTTTAITQALWNQVRATASPAGGVPAVGTFGYYLHSRVSTAGGGGGGGVLIKQGPFKVSSVDVGPNNVLDLVKGDNRNIVLSVIDENDENIPLNAAYTHSVKIYDISGALVATYAGTLDYANGGLVSFNIDTTTTNTTGTYNAVLVINDGVADTIYGGLLIEVKL